LTFIFAGIKVFSLQHEDFDRIWTWRVKESKSFGVRQDMARNAISLKLNSYCQGGKNLNPKSSGFLNEDVWDKRFLDGRSVDRGN